MTLISFALCIAALPVAIVGTFSLIPFWRWFEARTEVEAIGHSGPAAWCFAAVYVVVLVAAFGLWFLFRAKGVTTR
jgi:hypothetical protein